MAEGEAALREEMEKVRERTRLQALVQGAPAAEAESRADAAVAAFCLKWGLRIEVPPRPVHHPPTPLPRPLVGRAAAPEPAPPPRPAEPGSAAADAHAERRRRLLDEFDRTCIEVTAMIEDRIAACRGIEPLSSTGAGIAAADLARDLRSLRGGLRSMAALCEDLLARVEGRIPPGGGPPAGGAR